MKKQYYLYSTALEDIIDDIEYAQISSFEQQLHQYVW